jgi:glycosyltransferase involved in cell wall biosynthesis
MNARATTVCMMRVRNEARWIARSLARTFEVCRTVVIWDDGSTDETEQRVRSFLDEITRGTTRTTETPWGWRGSGRHHSGPADVEVHCLQSPFRPACREIQEVNEVRDKYALWEYVKAQVECRYVLCVDGDEYLSRALLRAWPVLLTMLDHSVEAVSVPIVYLWDGEDRRRVDGWYGDAGDGFPRPRFLRLFTTRHLDAQELFHLHFAHPGTRGGLHCGSVPGAGVRRSWRVGLAPGPIVHLGYLHAHDRERKYEWYNRIDPNNDLEGRYAHIVGRPDHHAPGPLRLAAWVDR